VQQHSAQTFVCIGCCFVFLGTADDLQKLKGYRTISGSRTEAINPPYDLLFKFKQLV